MPDLTFFRRLRGSVRTSTFEDALADELQTHIDLETDALVSRGMDQAAAAAEARRRFGSVALVRDSCRDSWGHRAIDEFAQDVRYARRMLARSPAYAALLRSLPFAGGDALVEVRQQASNLSNIGFSAPELDDYRRGATSLDAL